MLHFAIVGCGKMANWHSAELARLPDVKVLGPVLVGLVPLEI
jgi:hypothetical protein